MEKIIKKSVVKALVVLLLASSMMTGCTNNDQTKVSEENTAVNSSDVDTIVEGEGEELVNSGRLKDLIELAKFESKEIRPLERNLFYNGIILASDGSDHLWLVGKDGKQLPQKGLYYQVSQYISEGMIMVLANGGWGFIDTSGNVVIDFQYKGVNNFGDGLAAVKVSETGQDLWGFIDKTGNMVIKPQYEEAGRFTDGLCPVKLNGKYGFIDTKGKMVIDNKYDTAENFLRGTAIVSSDGGYSLIDKNGKILTDTLFSSIEYDKKEFLTNGLYHVKLGERDGFIEADTGKTIISPEYDWVWNFDEGVALTGIEADNGDGYIYIINRDGSKITVEGRYASANGFECGALQYTSNDSRSLTINKLGEVLTEEEVDYIYTYYNVLSTREENDKIALADAYYNPITEYKYDQVYDFIDGVAVACINQDEYLNALHGLVNNKGEEITEIKYNEIYRFSDGYIYGIIEQEDGICLIEILDKDAKLVKSFQMDSENLIKIRSNGSFTNSDLYGIMNKLLPGSMANFILSDDGYYYYINDFNDVGIADMDGNIIIEPDYDKLLMLIDLDVIYNFLNVK